METDNKARVLFFSILSLLVVFVFWAIAININSSRLNNSDIDVSSGVCPNLSNAQFRVGNTESWVSGADITARALQAPVRNFAINCFRDNGIGVIDYGTVRLTGPNSFSQTFNRPDVSGVTLTTPGTYTATCFARGSSNTICDTDTFTILGTASSTGRAVCGDGVCDLVERSEVWCPTCDTSTGQCIDVVCTTPNPNYCSQDCESSENTQSSNLKFCGPMDVNSDNYFTIIDFSNFSKFYNKTCRTQ